MFDFGYFLGLREPVFSDIVLAFLVVWIIIVITAVVICKIYKLITKPTFNKIWKIKIGEKNDYNSATKVTRSETV